MAHTSSHLGGALRPRRSHSPSHANPTTPMHFGRRPGPNLAAMPGRIIIARADPRYMPEVVRDTALARSCGGIHCTGQTRVTSKANILTEQGSAFARAGNMQVMDNKASLHWSLGCVLHIDCLQPHELTGACLDVSSCFEANIDVPEQAGTTA